MKYSSRILSILLTVWLFPGLHIPLAAQDTIVSFSLQGTDDEEVTLDELAEDNELVVLIFTSSHCSWAVKYEERLDSLFAAYQDKAVAFVAINSNDPSMSESDALARMKALSPFPFPYLKDADQSVAQLLGATRNPEVFVLQRLEGESGGKARYRLRYSGKIDDNPLDAALVKEPYLKNALDSLLAGKEPEPVQTTPSGCNIKWIR